MEDETVQEGLTVGEICRMILKRIWYILGATVAFTLIAVLIVYFAVNPAERWYSMRFDLVFPTGENTTYPDGEPFFYQSMVSSESLNEVKSTEGLGGINVDKMVRDDDVEIAAETAERNGVTVNTGGYTVRVKSSYFSGEEQAEAFIHAIAQTTVDRMKAEAGAVDYAISKDTFDGAPFEERLNLLAQERETILEKYDEWIAIYDAAYKLKVGETEQSLKDYRASVTACFGESVQKKLEDELTSGGYYFTEDFKEYTEKLNAEYERNAAEIEMLKGTSQSSAIALMAQVTSPWAETDVQIGSSSPTVSQRLAELIERNNKIAFWLGKNGSTATLTETSNKAFADRLEAEREDLAKWAETLTAVTQAIYSRGMSARFDMQNVDAEGGISIILTAVAAFIVAFLVACVAVCAIETNRRKKALAKAAGTPEKQTLEESAPEENAPEEKNG